MLKIATRLREMRWIVVAGVVLGAAGPSWAGQGQDGGVKVAVEKHVDFSRFKTYSWTPSQPAPDKAVDERIVAAVDGELRSVGLTKAAPGSAGDVLVTYSALRRLDVTGEAVGTLVVGMLEPGTRRRLLQLRAEHPIEGTPTTVDAAITRVVGQLFAKYPTRAR
jgi:Domain of unknown function (DUF4136)